MDPTSIPKKYGGQLNWAWGDIPDLDDETRTALERDGNKGWVKGPALWLNNERIVVGSQDGKLRRSDKEIAEKKPIVYAADYTEDPVHPEKRLSVISASKKSLDVQSPRQEASVLSHPSPLPESPSTLVEDKQLGAPTAAAAASATQTTGTQQPPPALSPIPSHIPIEEVRTGPMGDSQVHLPVNQAAPPSTTAEYISPVPSKEHIAPPVVADQVNENSSQKAPTSHPPAAKSEAVPAAVAAMPTSSTVPSTSTTQRETSPPPPGHTQPGPLSQHTAEIHRAIAQKLEGESLIEIPASADAALPHPDIIATSDAGKGLAMEAEKLNLSARPQPERFVTALEVPH